MRLVQKNDIITKLTEPGRRPAREDIPISALMDSINRKRLNPVSRYQRAFVWSLDDTQCFIDSVIRHCVIPNVVCVTRDNGTRECLDGQQRIRTLQNFINNEFPINLAEGSKGITSGYTPEEIIELRFRDFDESEKNWFYDLQPFSIMVYEKKSMTKEEEEDMYNRLQNGKPLESGEKLYGKQSSPLIQAIAEQIETPYKVLHAILRQRIFTDNDIKRKQLYRFCLIAYMIVSGAFDKGQKTKAKALDRYLNGINNENLDKTLVEKIYTYIKRISDCKCRASTIVATCEKKKKDNWRLSGVKFWTIISLFENEKCVLYEPALIIATVQISLREATRYDPKAVVDYVESAIKDLPTIKHKYDSYMTTQCL